MRWAISVEHVARREVDEPLDEVEARAPDAGRVHRLELGVGDVAIDRRDPASAAVRRQQGIDERAVVGAVAGRLDDDVLVEAQVIAKCEQQVLRRVARRVLALGRVGELVSGAEHVTVRVHRARRELERGNDGLGWKGSQPGVTWLLHASSNFKGQSWEVRPRA